MENYIKGIQRHGIHKKPPNSFSNPNIVISKENEEENQGNSSFYVAMRNAKVVEQRRELKEKENEEKMAENRQKAIERGQKAMEKINKQREYENYCQDVAQDQVSYNINRLTAGKKNQYT